jgi:hypothetical protein
MVDHRPVLAACHLVLARPDQLKRALARALGDADAFHDLIRHRQPAATERTTRGGHVDLDAAG